MSGGLLYHFRAVLHGKNQGLWSSHQVGVKQFLDRWNPPEKSLVLIGPSGGYSLPKFFLERFSEVIAIEPDLLARLIFEKRFLIKPKWIKGRVNFNRLDNLEGLIPPGAAILFCNLLGQVPLNSTSHIAQVFKKNLSSRSWASFHDALSGELLEFDTELAEPLKKANLVQMKAWIYPKVKLGSVLTVNAHQAPDLFRDEKNNHFFYWQWRIIPRRTHLIEGVFHIAENKALR